MNSLVVFLSLVALAVAKPSGFLHGGIIPYAAPAITTFPAAVSSQSRIDIKSSPAVISTAAVAPIARTVIAEPAIVAPAAIAAPAAVSHQSRIDIKSSPAIVGEVVANPIAAIAPAVVKTIAAPGIVAAPAFLNSGIIAAPGLVKSAISAPAIIASPTLVKSAIAGPAIIGNPTLVKSAIAAPIAFPALSTVYGAHAAIAAPAITAPLIPQETPEVAAARAAHLEAKAQAIAEQHLIHKRSIGTYAASPLISTYAAAPVIHTPTFIHSAPLAYSTPLVTKAYGVHPW